jgi:hypothetical protein
MQGPDLNPQPHKNKTKQPPLSEFLCLYILKGGVTSSFPLEKEHQPFALGYFHPSKFLFH